MKQLPESFEETLIAAQVYTDENRHTDALMEIARALGLSDWVTVFNAVDAIYSVEGHLSSDVGSIRGRFAQKMFERIESLYGIDVVKRIKENC